MKTLLVALLALVSTSAFAYDYSCSVSDANGELFSSFAGINGCWSAAEFIANIVQHPVNLLGGDQIVTEINGQTRVKWITFNGSVSPLPVDKISNACLLTKPDGTEIVKSDVSAGKCFVMAKARVLETGAPVKMVTVDRMSINSASSPPNKTFQVDVLVEKN